MKLNIKKNDKVIVTTGDSKGSIGTVDSINREKLTAIVRDVNLVTKHRKPSAKYPQGGIVKEPAAIHISNLQLIDPKSNKATRIGKRRESDGSIVRISKKSGEVIK